MAETTFRLFSSSDDTNSGFGFFDAPQKPSVPKPPCIEVLASEVFLVVAVLNFDELVLIFWVLF